MAGGSSAPIAVKNLSHDVAQMLYNKGDVDGLLKLAHIATTNGCRDALVARRAGDEILSDLPDQPNFTKYVTPGIFRTINRDPNQLLTLTPQVQRK